MKIQGRFVIDTRKNKLTLIFDGDKKVKVDKVRDFIRQANIVVQLQEIITGRQFKYIMALCSDFARSFGEDTAYYKYYLKSLFCIMEEVPYFSCRTTTKDVARRFIDFIIGKGLEHGANFSVAPYRQGINVEKYVYMCLEKKVCCKCNRSKFEGHIIHLHHHTTVASNAGRKYNDDELLKMSLCGECHSLAHSIGLKTFTEKFKLVGVHYDSQKWYGKRVWTRLTKAQKFKKFQETPADDLEISKYISDEIDY